MPSGRRMSSECTITSPSSATFGSGGAVVLVTTRSKRASVSAGEEPRCSARRIATCLSKSNRQRITPAIQRTAFEARRGSHVREDLPHGEPGTQ